MASSMSCVTSKVVTGLRATSSTSAWPSCAASACVQRHERLVEQQQIGLDGEGPRQRHAAREAERKLAGIVLAMRGEASDLEQRRQRVGRRVRRRQPDIVLDRAPRQQPRLLEHHAEPAVMRQLHRAVVVAIEAGDDAEQCGLAAARRPDQRADFAIAQAKRQIGDDAARAAQRRAEGLLRDPDVKLGWDATGRHVVQAAAPEVFRSRA